MDFQRTSTIAECTCARGSGDLKLYHKARLPRARMLSFITFVSAVPNSTPSLLCKFVSFCSSGKCRNAETKQVERSQR